MSTRSPVIQRSLPGAVATALGAGAWGLLWLPLQSIESAGLTGLWSIGIIQLGAALAAVLAVLYSRTLNQLANPDNWLVGISMGLSIVLYFYGILVSDVVRVIFLFYSLPAWAILWNLLLYRVVPIPRHYLVITVGMCGLWMLLSDGASGLPLPRNAGDWCGLMAGALWGLGLVLLQHRQSTTPREVTLISCGSACVFAFVALFALQGSPLDSIDVANLQTGVPAALMVGACLQCPIMLSLMWGGIRLTAPTAALLTMAEILTATISYSLIAGSSLGLAAWAGGVIIVLAGVIDIVGGQRSSINAVSPPA